MADITRAELGLGLFLGYLVTSKGRVIGEIRAPVSKVEIRSLQAGRPAFAVDAKTNATLNYQEICKIDVPEGGFLSLEDVSFYASAEPDYALFKVEIGDIKLQDIPLASNLAVVLPFRGRVELKTGQKVSIAVKTSDVAHTVKGHGSINGVIL